jgi:hypothetical protein
MPAVFSAPHFVIGCPEPVLGADATYSENAFVVDCAIVAASVTFTPTVYDPEAFGDPESVPLLESVTPAGSAPDTSDQR